MQKYIKFTKPSAITELQTLTELLMKEPARLDKISDLQGVLKDFIVISFLYMKITQNPCEFW
jgi:hypothetical protein